MRYIKFRIIYETAFQKGRALPTDVRQGFPFSVFHPPRLLIFVGQRSQIQQPPIEQLSFSAYSICTRTGLVQVYIQLHGGTMADELTSGKSQMWNVYFPFTKSWPCFVYELRQHGCQILSLTCFYHPQELFRRTTERSMISYVQIKRVGLIGMSSLRYWRNRACRNRLWVRYCLNLNAY